MSIHDNPYKRNFEIKPIIKKPIVTNNTFFTCSTLSKINSFAYINPIVIQHL